MALDRELRILHVLNHIRESGNGIVNATIDLACSQAKLGHQVAVASAGGEYETLLQEHGVQHFSLDQHRSLGNITKMWQRYGAIINSFRPHIVHGHMMVGVLLAWGYRQSHRCQPASVMAALPSLRATQLHERDNCDYAISATVHNEFQSNAILMGLADQLICVSQAVANAMQRRGVPATKLQVVLNGTLGSPRQATKTSEPAVKLAGSAILTVAGMYRRKGISELIEAFSRLSENRPHLNLYIVGDGPDRQEFEQQAQETSVADRIHFEGFQANPLAYMRAADIFVLASHREPFGLVLSEARSAGCAIVASDVDGIPEALDGGKAGILCSPQSSSSLEIALLKLVNDPEKLEDYQARSRKNLGRFQVARVAEETLLVYAKMLPVSVANGDNVAPSVAAKALPSTSLG
ncbi:MAG: glycosyltransferase [Leptolyngbyaceae cyanobacterium MAG.088]|nr:glycosyltransferase [Leptolyngbyaceae cyanobacterium MAG.088]